MTVNEMLTKMSSNEIVEWMIFLKIEAESDSDRQTQRDMLKRLAAKKGRRLGL